MTKPPKSTVLEASALRAAKQYQLGVLPSGIDFTAPGLKTIYRTATYPTLCQRLGNCKRDCINTKTHKVEQLCSKSVVKIILQKVQK